VRGLSVDLRLATDPTLLDLRSLSWREGPWGSRMQRLAGTVAVTDSVVIVMRELRSRDLQMRGRATWQRGARQARHRRDPAPALAWLARVVRNRTLDVPGEGGWCRRRGDPVWQGARRRRRVDGLPVEAAPRFRWRNGRLFLEDLRGSSPAGRIAGASSTGAKVVDRGRGERRRPVPLGVLGIDNWPAAGPGPVPLRGGPARGEACAARRVVGAMEWRLARR